jgi:DNA-binding NtrC family response regulator
VKDLLEELIVRMVDNEIFYTDAVGEFEKRFIKKVLEKNNGNQSKAAQALGIHRNTLSRKIEILGLDNNRPKRRKRPSR